MVEEITKLYYAIYSHKNEIYFFLKYESVEFNLEKN